MSQALSFQSVKFDVIQQNQQPWVRSPQIGEALGYAKGGISIAKLYEAHADEFTDAMTAVVTLPTEGGPQETRIFSLRGCHLLAMFARTPVAKQFRRWVLDVLDRLAEEERARIAEDVTPSASRPSRRTDPERKALTAIINTWVGMAPVHYASARAQVNAHFGVASVDHLTVAQVKEAIKYVQGKIDALPPAPNRLALPAPDASFAEKAATAIKHITRLRDDVFRASVEVRDTFTLPFWNSRTIPNGERVFAKAMNDAVNGFFMAINHNLISAEEMFKAYVEGEKILHQRG